jgi:peroxiredoxin
MKAGTWLLAMFLVASAGIQYWAHSVFKPSRPTLSLKEGATAPSLSLQDLDGTQVSLDSFRGRVVILDFWATWCKPCRAELKTLKSWWDQERATGLLDSVDVLAVNLEEPASLVERFVTTSAVPFRVLLDTDGAVAQAYGVRALPTLVVIDREGRVVDSVVGYDPMTGSTLSDILGKMEKERSP